MVDWKRFVSEVSVGIGHYRIQWNKENRSYLYLAPGAKQPISFIIERR